MNNNNIKPNYYSNNNFFTPDSLLEMDRIEVTFHHSNSIAKDTPFKSEYKVWFKAAYNTYNSYADKKLGRKSYSSDLSRYWILDATNTIVFFPPATSFLLSYSDGRPDAKHFDWALGMLKTLRQAVPSFKYLFLDVKNSYIEMLKKSLGKDAIIRPYRSSNGSNMCIFIYEIDKIKDIDKVEIFDPKLPDTIKAAYNDYNKKNKK